MTWLFSHHFEYISPQYLVKITKTRIGNFFLSTQISLIKVDLLQLSWLEYFHIILSALHHNIWWRLQKQESGIFFCQLKFHWYKLICYNFPDLNIFTSFWAHYTTIFGEDIKNENRDFFFCQLKFHWYKLICYNFPDLNIFTSFWAYYTTIFGEDIKNKNREFFFVTSNFIN